MTQAHTGLREELEEALRLAEVGEYLYEKCAYSYGDGYSEPREYGIEWQWQQSKPNEYGQGQLLKSAVEWHEQQKEDGITTEATKLRDALSALLPDPALEKAREALAPAARDVLAERERQKTVEGWTQAHDDGHDAGDLALAAGCYALVGSGQISRSEEPPPYWPFNDGWWKSTTARRDLVKAGALILAEIERLDRAVLSSLPEKEGERG